MDTADARATEAVTGLEHLEAELKLSKSQQVRAMAKLSVAKAKSDKQVKALQTQISKLGEDKSALFREASYKIQVIQVTSYKLHVESYTARTRALSSARQVTSYQL